MGKHGWCSLRKSRRAAFTRKCGVSILSLPRWRNGPHGRSRARAATGRSPRNHATSGSVHVRTETEGSRQPERGRGPRTRSAPPVARNCSQASQRLWPVGCDAPQTLTHLCVAPSAPTLMASPRVKCQSSAQGEAPARYPRLSRAHLEKAEDALSSQTKCNTTGFSLLFAAQSPAGAPSCLTQFSACVGATSWIAKHRGCGALPACRGWDVEG